LAVFGTKTVGWGCGVWQEGKVRLYIDRHCERSEAIQTGSSHRFAVRHDVNEQPPLSQGEVKFLLCGPDKKRGSPP